MGINVVQVNNFPVDETGRLLVRQVEAEAPPDTTPVSLFYYGEHNGTMYAQEFEIPINKQLHFLSIVANSQDSRDGTIVEIRDRGLDDQQWELVCLPVIINGNEIYRPIDTKIVKASSTGSRWIELLVINSQRVFSGACVSGYLEDLEV